jgi:hypothetical protein
MEGKCTFNVVFVYMDGEKFEVEIHPDDMETFIQALGKCEVYFSNQRGVGVWIPIDKIRYFQLEKVDEHGRRVTEGDKRVFSDDGSVEKGAGEKGKASVAKAGKVPSKKPAK